MNYCSHLVITNKTVKAEKAPRATGRTAEECESTGVDEVTGARETSDGVTVITGVYRVAEPGKTAAEDEEVKAAVAVLAVVGVEGCEFWIEAAVFWVEAAVFWDEVAAFWVEVSAFSVEDAGQTEGLSSRPQRRVAR
ncbi:hypothetical protein GZ78_23340 [Endozoicomonas numazuensis]|uniref:Uncharacterized protein n=1 Tax=Endozoicomonas numazuensis TaxID=1137799 RepID=A0A081NCK7_9GAMM|nr:hypothetical protein GZ78_23340 [Endozoicomonas numazuensis]